MHDLQRNPTIGGRKTAGVLPSLLACLGLAVVLEAALPQVVHAQPSGGRPFLPAWETPAEKNPPAQRRFKNAAFRNTHPEMYGITVPPAQPVKFYAEFEPVDAIYYVWFPGWSDDLYYEMTQALADYAPQVSIHLLVDDAQGEQDLRDLLQSMGGDPNEPVYLDMSGWAHYGDYPLDSIWMVDSGPYWVLDGNGVLGVVDPRYYFDRVNDDAIPFKLSDLMGLTTYRPDVAYEGGNIMSDGRGLCVSTAEHVIMNLPHTQQDVEQILAAYLGCEKMIWVERLVGEGTGHVDMFAKFLGPQTVIVGSYAPTDDAENAQILDDNAALLENETTLDGSPLEVVRIPMPDNDNRQVWRTYTNSVLVNDLVLVPVYAGETSRESAALQVYESLLPGKTIVGIEADDIITAGGALHCITRTRPIATHAPLEPNVADQCNGEWRCLSGCGQYSYTGECLYNHSVYCNEENDLIVDDCTAEGGICGWDFDHEYIDCVDAGCGPVSATGQCRTVEGQQYAIWCEDGYPVADWCEAGQQCALDTQENRYRCLECTDACAMGDTGCASDLLATWTCGEAGDGDVCLDKIYEDCPPGSECHAGQCTTPCDDECAVAETGCASDLLSAWTCGEGGDGDVCLERIYSECPTATICATGQCVAGCLDECAAAESGCATDLRTAWTCGEAGDGDDCLEKVYVPCGAKEICNAGQCEIAPPAGSGGGCGCRSVAAPIVTATAAAGDSPTTTQNAVATTSDPRWLFWILCTLLGWGVLRSKQP
jgi:agmatine deiminase